MKKKILVIAPSSFPVNGAEAIVNIKLLKVLSEAGYEIDLVSKRRKKGNYPSGDIESYGVRLNSLNIIEVDNRITMSSILGSFMCLLGFDIIYPGCHWAYYAKKIVKKLCLKNKYDYVLTKDTPSFILGRYCQRKFGLKWVASWNDPFPAKKYPSPYGKGKDAELNMWGKKITTVMSMANIHIFPNERLKKYMCSYLSINSKDSIVIPHVVMEPKDRLHKKSNCLRILHTGKLCYPRDPRPFIKVLKETIEEYSEMKVSLSIIGGVDKSLSDYIEEIGANDIVEILPPLEYQESLSVLRNYDISVIIEANCEEGIFLPTKVSDFMQNRMPIFALSPSKGVLNDLFKNNKIGYFAPVDNVREIKKELLRVYNDFIQNKLESKTGIDDNYLWDEVVKQYDTI